MVQLRVALLTALCVCHLKALRAQEMAILANALDVCAIDTGYYVALEALDDTSDSNSSPPFNDIDDQGGSYAVRPWEGRFSTSRIRFTTAVFPWRGPYVTYQPSRILQSDIPYDRGSPLDPWGNPYYFFSPLGLLRGDTGSVTLELYGDQFDRYTLASLGPDGVKSSDDLIYQFGPGLTVRAISSLRGPGVVPLTSGPNARFSKDGTSSPQYLVVPGTVLTIRGVNLFDAQGRAAVRWESTEFSDVLSTNSREIVVHVPESLQGAGALEVTTPAGEKTNSVYVQITAVTASRDWMLYE